MKKGLILSVILVSTFVMVQAQRNEVVADAGDCFKTSAWLRELDGFQTNILI